MNAIGEKAAIQYKLWLCKYPALKHKSSLQSLRVQVKQTQSQIQGVAVLAVKNGTPMPHRSGHLGHKYISFVPRWLLKGDGNKIKLAWYCRHKNSWAVGKKRVMLSFKLPQFSQSYKRFSPRLIHAKKIKINLSLHKIHAVYGIITTCLELRLR